MEMVWSRSTHKPASSTAYITAANKYLGRICCPTHHLNRQQYICDNRDSKRYILLSSVEMLSAWMQDVIQTLLLPRLTPLHCSTTLPQPPAPPTLHVHSILQVIAATQCHATAPGPVVKKFTSDYNKLSMANRLVTISSWIIHTHIHYITNVHN